jgi:hypothetical protein
LWLRWELAVWDRATVHIQKVKIHHQAGAAFMVWGRGDINESNVQWLVFSSCRCDTVPRVRRLSIINSDETVQSQPHSSGEHHRQVEHVDHIPALIHSKLKRFIKARIIRFMIKKITQLLFH